VLFSIKADPISPSDYVTEAFIVDPIQ